MATSKVAGFTTIPIETRLEIYSYLLLSFNAVGQKSVERPYHMENPEAVVEVPQISTALFTINRQISQETINYFYRENAFVAVRTNFREVFVNCMLLFPGFLWTDEDCTDATLSRRSRCIKMTGIFVDIEVFASRFCIDYDLEIFIAEPWIFVFNLRYLAMVFRFLNASHFQAIPNKDIVMHLDYFFADPDDGGPPRVHETLTSALQILKSDYKDDGSPYLALILTGVIAEQKAASLRSIRPSRNSVAELFKDCEWIMALGDRERGDGNLKRAENYYNAAIHFLGGRDPSDQANRHIDLQRLDLSIGRELRLAVNHSLAKEYETATAHASRAGNIAFRLDTQSKEEMDMRTRFLYRVARVYTSLGDYDRTHSLIDALALLCRAVRDHTDPVLEQLEEIHATMREVSVELKALGVRLEDEAAKSLLEGVSFDPDFREYMIRSASSMVSDH